MESNSTQLPQHRLNSVVRASSSNSKLQQVVVVSITTTITITTMHM
jgi:hypothetical protein